MYVNGLPQGLRRCDLTLFADDTVVCTSANDAATLEAQLNCLSTSNKRVVFFVNRLALNKSKCKFVLVGSTQRIKSFQNFSLCINDFQLQ